MQRTLRTISDLMAGRPARAMAFAIEDQGEAAA